MVAAHPPRHTLVSETKVAGGWAATVPLADLCTRGGPPSVREAQSLLAEQALVRDRARSANADGDGVVLDFDEAGEDVESAAGAAARRSGGS